MDNLKLIPEIGMPKIEMPKIEKHKIETLWNPQNGQLMQRLYSIFVKILH